MTPDQINAMILAITEMKRLNPDYDVLKAMEYIKKYFK